MQGVIRNWMKDGIWNFTKNWTSKRIDGMGDVRKKFRFKCYINFGFSFGSSESKISFDELIKLRENTWVEAVSRNNLTNVNSEFAYIQNAPTSISYKQLSLDTYTLFSLML
jgi:hypothetical protein